MRTGDIEEAEALAAAVLEDQEPGRYSGLIADAAIVRARVMRSRGESQSAESLIVRTIATMIDVGTEEHIIERLEGEL